MNELDIFLQEGMMLALLADKYKSSNPRVDGGSTTIRLPIKVEAPSTSRWGRFWQRIRKIGGRVKILHGDSLAPRMLGSVAAEIFDSCCDPATYSKGHIKEIQTEVHCLQPEATKYYCTVLVRREKNR